MRHFIAFLIFFGGLGTVLLLAWLNGIPLYDPEHWRETMVLGALTAVILVWRLRAVERVR